MKRNCTAYRKRDRMKKYITMLTLLLAFTTQAQAKVDASKCSPTHSSHANTLCNASDEFYRKVDVSRIRFISSRSYSSNSGLTINEYFYSALKWHKKDIGINRVLLRAILVPDDDSTEWSSFRFLYTRTQDLKE